MFEATSPFIPTSTETLTIPDGTAGPTSTHGAVLAAPVTVTFTVAQASTERLQQLLAEAGYLPLTFTATGSLPPNGAATAQPGTFAWRWTTLPPDLTSLWTEGSENVITKAAVMTFENQNGLTVDGLAGQAVWTALLAAVAGGKTDTSPVSYTHLDVYKRQALQSMGCDLAQGYFWSPGIPAAEVDRLLAGNGVMPVAGELVAGGPARLAACLLYTSRCV